LRIGPQVTSLKYLGSVLGAQLDFSLQAECATGKAKRASPKVSTLYDGREGNPKCKFQVHNILNVK